MDMVQRPAVHRATNKGSYSAAVREMLARKRSRGQKARLHVVAVGDYFKPEVGRFLQTLARENDGTFIGR